MGKKHILFLLFLLIATLLCGCSEGVVRESVTAITFDAPPERVVVLQASLADLWLTAGGTVVGVTDDAQERGLDVGAAAMVGTTKNPSTEAILALKPDLVIYSPDIAGQSAAAEVLKSAGIPLLPAKVDSFADYLFQLERFTGLTGQNEAYKLYGEAVAAEIQSIRASVPEYKTPSVLFLRAYSSGVKAKATEHTVCDILNDLGARNIAASENSLLETLSLEVIAREDPDYILVVTMGSDEDAAAARLEETLFSQPLWQSLSAVREGRLVYLPRELFHFKPNARWAEAYSYVYEILYP